MPGLLRGVPLAHVASPPRYISSSFTHTHTSLSFSSSFVHTYTLQRICVEFRARVPAHTHRLVFIMRDSLRLRIFNTSMRMHALVHARIFTRLSVVRKSLVHDVREGCTGDFVATDILTDEKKFTFPLGFPRLSTFRGNLIPTLTGSFANRSVSRVYPRCVCKDLFFFSNRKSRVRTKIGK